MAITDEVIRSVARLSRMELSDEELETLRSHINALLDHIQVLQTADVEGVEPTHHVLDVRNVFRSDEPQPSLPRADLLRNAPEQADGCFLVPRVLEDQGS